MIMEKYTIGLDFGTLAGRAVLVNVCTGEEIAEAVYEYPHGVLEHSLPGSDQILPAGYALQDPEDYPKGVEYLLRSILESSHVPAENIIGIGVDATASTVLPLDSDLQPLCLRPEFRNNPHSWIKLWKHHSTQKYADRINTLAAERREPFLKRCGGKVCAEWFYPKVLETLAEAPEVFHNTECFVELGDWLVFLLTDELKRSSAIAGLHANWSEVPGEAPSKDFLIQLAPELTPFAEVRKKLPILPAFSRAGGLSEQLAFRTGLLPGTAVSAATTDSPVAMLSLGATEEGSCALILGTSGVLMFPSSQSNCISGAMACVKDQMLPGAYGNMFGQSSVGDSYGWFAENLVPYRIYREAEKNGESVFSILNRSLEQISPENTSVIALDWLNGSRSLLQNASLKGGFWGLTLSATTEQLYHALVESTAFELKTIVDAVSDAGVTLNEIRACGGISGKSPEIMQLFADVLSLPIMTYQSAQTVGRGAAILGALSAGKEKGGYDSVAEAVRAMGCSPAKLYRPEPRRSEIYRNRYREYLNLYHHFGQIFPYKLGFDLHLLG